MKPNDSTSNLVLPAAPINTSNEGSNNREPVVIMTSRPQGHTAIKGSDYIIIGNKGPNVAVDKQVSQFIHQGQHNQQIPRSNNLTLHTMTSPATDALDYILEDTKPNLEISNTSMDESSLLIDLNELLRRDPTLSMLEDSKSSSPQLITTAPNVAVMNAANLSITNRPGVTIPGTKLSGMLPNATITSGQVGNATGFLDQNRMTLGMGGSLGSSNASSNGRTAFDHGSLVSTSPTFFPSNAITTNTKIIPDTITKMDTSGLVACTSPTQQLVAGEHAGHAVAASNPIIMNMINQQIIRNQQGPTLAQLNSPTDNDATSGLLTTSTGIKMEVSDFDDLDALFLSSASPNVSLGIPQTDVKPQIQVTRQIASPSSPLSHQIKQEPGLSPLNNSSWNNRNVQASNTTPLTNMNFWQATTDEMIFGRTSPGQPSNMPPSAFGGSSAGAGATFSPLSSSVPINLFQNVSSPLSDILTDLSPFPANTYIPSTAPVSVVSSSLRSTTSPPNFQFGSPIANPLPPPNTPSQSNAGPTRNSTLHKLLMQRKGDQHITGRPSPVRSPEARKTLEQMKNSLSASNPLISQQLLSRSAPTSNPIGTGTIPMENRTLWSRREPRQHISSVCSVGEESSIADEVNDVLAELSPTDDLHDIASDDEDEELPGNYPDDRDSSDDDSDYEGTSPSMGRLSTSAGSSGGSGKKERHFWQYNVQAKGPKGQKIVIDTKMEDPHTLNDIVDPVFSGDVQLQGIKHSGKARRGDGNDLTANPRKLAAIGKELEQLSRVINDMTPVSEMPFGARCKSRKEKNKLASRACRLKKKAQHEANKVKCDGLLEEHRVLSNSLEHVKGLLLAKMDPQSSKTQVELTVEVEQTVQHCLSLDIAGNTTSYVNQTIERNLPYV